MLSDVEVQDELRAGRIRFEPEIPPELVDEVSVTLRLNDIFWIPDLPQGETKIVESSDSSYDYMRQEKRDEFLLAPNGFILGETFEAITVPAHLTCEIQGKSGLARHGLLVHCTAPYIWPGWGQTAPKRVTLELKNLNQAATIRLVAGAPIAQIVFHKHGIPTARPYQGQHSTRGSQA